MPKEASRHAQHWTSAQHYHVIAENYDGVLIYSDGFTWPGAQAFAADLVSPPNGTQTYEPVQTLWIVVIDGDPLLCPLAHGDNNPADGQDADFVEHVVQRQQPYWSA